jgi:hypothetical protein
MKLKSLNVNEIFNLHEVDQNKVEQMIKHGIEKLSPIIVLKESEDYYIAIDGNHRLEAYNQSEEETIQAYIIPQNVIEFIEENGFEMASGSAAIYKLNGYTDEDLINGGNSFVYQVGEILEFMKSINQ